MYPELISSEGDPWQLIERRFFTTTVRITRTTYRIPTRKKNIRQVSFVLVFTKNSLVHFQSLEDRTFVKLQIRPYRTKFHSSTQTITQTRTESSYDDRLIVILIHVFSGTTCDLFSFLRRFHQHIYISYNIFNSPRYNS